jgi:cathepsin D
VSLDTRCSVLELTTYPGTTLIVGDTQDVLFFYENVPGAKDASSVLGPGFFTVPCNAVPTLSLGFAGTTFSVSPSIFNLGQLFEGGADCVGGLMGEDIGQNLLTYPDQVRCLLYVQASG